MSGVDELRAVLAAYQQVKNTSWPALHPEMAERSKRWATASEAELRAELDSYLAESSKPESPVRVFWKTGADFAFAGCNEHFARDAGASTPAELIGRTDFDKRLPWKPQAAKYRVDDEKVVRDGVVFGAVERQQSSQGEVTWVRVGKAPIRLSPDRVVGVFGMYEVLDATRGPKLYGEWLRKQPKSAREGKA